MDMDPNNATEQTATAAADKVIQTVESEARSLKRDIDGEVQAVIKKETDQKGGGDGGPIVKKARIEDGARNGGRDARDSGDGRRKGVAPVKKEYVSLFYIPFGQPKYMENAN